MPSMPMSRANAWSLWTTARVAAANVENLAVESTPSTSILTNLAVKHGYNAIRLWLNWGVSSTLDYTLLPQDWRKIAWEGWDSLSHTTRSALYPANQKVTIQQVGQRVTAILDKCQALGMGVIFTGDFFSRQGGRLWTDQAAGNEFDFPANLSNNTNNPTTAAGLQGDLGLFWQKTIQKFGAHAALVGVDILNEPDPTRRLSLAEGRSATRHDTWPRLAQYLIDKIREVDASAAAGSATRLPIIVQGTLEPGVGLNLFRNLAAPTDSSFLLRDYSYGASNAPNSNTADDRIVYSSHAYLPGWVAGQGVAADTYLALGSTYPISNLTHPIRLARHFINVDGQQTAVAYDYNNYDDWDKIFAAERSIRIDLNRPVFLGEFGSVQPRLDLIYPPRNDRAPGQWVSTVPAVSAATVASEALDVRQVTRIEWDAGSQTYTLGLDNIADPTFQPTPLLDPSLVLEDDTYSSDDFTINAEGRPVDWLEQVVPVGGWRVNWFASENLTAQLNLVVGGSVSATPVFQNVPVTIIGGVKSVKIKASLIAPTQLQTTPLGTPVNGKYPVVGVLSFGTSLTPNEINWSRVWMAVAMLQLCQRHKFSWAYFTEDLDQSTFVGWRPTPSIRAYLSKAARGESV